MSDSLQVITDDDGLRLLLCLGKRSRLEAINEARALLGSLVVQYARRPFHAWEWELRAEEISEPVAGWAAVAEHEASERKGRPFTTA